MLWPFIEKDNNLCSQRKREKLRELETNFRFHRAVNIEGEQDDLFSPLSPLVLGCLFFPRLKCLLHMDHLALELSLGSYIGTILSGRHLESMFPYRMHITS